MAQNDILVAFVVHYDNLTSTITPPTGWSQQDDQISGTTNNHIRATSWIKVAGASEPTTYQWSGTGSPYTDIVIVAYSGGNTSTPVDTSTESAGENVATQYTATGLTTAVNGEILICCAATYNSGSDVASGMTDRGGTSDNAVRVQDEARATAGATGNRSAAFWSSPDDFVALLVAIRPAVGGGGGTTPVSLAGALTLLGTLLKRVLISMEGAFTEEAQVIPVSLAGALAPAAGFVKRISRARAGTLTTAGALVTSVTPGIIALGGTLTTAGAAAKVIARSLAGAPTGSGAIVQRVGKSLTGSLAPAAALVLVQSRTRSYAGTLTTTGVLAASKIKLLAFSGTLTTAGGAPALVRVRQVTMGGTLFTSAPVPVLLRFRTPVPFPPEAIAVVPEEAPPEFALLEEV